MELKKLLNASSIATSEYLKKNSPAILVAAGIAGMVTAAVIACKETPRMQEDLKKVKKQVKNEPIKTRVVEEAKVIAPRYIPATVLGVGSIACILGSYKINVSRIAAVTTALSLREAKYSDYRAHVIKELGEKKEASIRDSISAEKVEKNPPNPEKVIYTKGGNQLCLDAYSGRYFYSSVPAIERAENKINKELITEMFIPINEFYYELGIPSNRAGEDAGWDLDQCLNHQYGDGSVEIKITTTKANFNNEVVPCFVVDYEYSTKYCD